MYVGQRVPLWLSVTLIAGPIAYYVIIEESRSSSATAFVVDWSGAGAGMIVVLLGLTLLVGVRASGTITGERERHTWDGLLTAPFSARDLVRGKLRGVLLRAWPLLLTFYLAAA